MAKQFNKPENVLQVRLGALASLDIVRVPEEQYFLIVFAERGVIQRRTLAQLPYEEAAMIAQFLSNAPKLPPEYDPAEEEEWDADVEDVDMEDLPTASEPSDTTPTEVFDPRKTTK